MRTEEKMREMITRLNAAADAYYNGRGEQMTDFEWDALFDELRKLEDATGVILEGSPTRHVSADAIPGGKEEHEFAALSLAKTKNPAEVVKWAENRPIWLSWKLDGLTLVATYEGGHLVKVLTRGDGHIGTNITHLAGSIAGIPKTIPIKEKLTVRGEAVISYADFKSFLETSEEDYANPRNLAAGSLTLKDTEELKRRNLQWVPFTLVDLAGAPVSWGARMDMLDKAGFHSVARERIDNPDLAHLQAAIARWTEKVTGGENPFPVDGLVVAYDDTAYAQTGSVTGHHATRAGFAFKWQDEAAETELDHIEWSCAVSSISPIAVFKPVALEGTTVRRASLCNLSECERLGIGDAGTRISVIKANKIIPKVVAVTQSVGTFTWPKTCPVCGAPTQVTESESGTKKLICTNPACAARALRKFMRFTSDDGMQIDGLAGETLAKFVNRGWIRTVADIYRLKDHALEMAAMEGFGQRSAEKILSAIEAARSRDGVKILVALGIPLIGTDVAKRLLGAYHGDVKALIAAGDAVDAEATLSAIDGIGPAKSASFVNWLRQAENRALLDDLFREVTPVVADLPAKSGTLAGMTFVVTGDVHHFANRAAFKTYIESQGGRMAGSVSKSTNFLVNNDATSTSGKNKKAQELGVAIITEDEFVARFGQP